MKFTEDTSTSSSFQFGLNPNCKLKTFSLVTTDGNPYVLVEIEKNGKTFNQRYYTVTRAFDGKNGITEDPNNPAFKEAENEFAKVLIHFASRFVKVDVLKEALKEEMNQLDFIKVIISLMPENFQEIPIDVFLQYQWKIGKNADRTFFELPKKVRFNERFVALSTPDVEWEEEMVEGKTDKHVDLKYFYTKDDKKVYHVFERNHYFMSNNHAIVQKTDTPSTTKDDDSIGNLGFV